MHSICSSLRAFLTNLSREAFKADKKLALFGRVIRRRDGISLIESHTATQETN